MHKTINHILFFFLLFFARYSFAQPNPGDSLSDLLLKAQHDTVRIRLFQQLSGTFRDNDPEKAIDFAKKAHELAVKLKDSKAIAESIKCIGNAWLVRGEFSKSIEQYKQALEIQENMGDKEGMASSLNNLGLAYRMLGNLDSALIIHAQCLTIDEGRKDKGGIAYSLGNIAAVYRIKGDFVKSLDYQIRCMKMLEELQDENALGICLANIASVYKELGNLPASMEYNEKALEKFEKTGNKTAIGHLLNNISNLLDDMKDYEKALGYMQRAIKIREELGDNHGLATSYINLATLYTKMKMGKEALDYYQRAVTMMEESGDNNGMGIALAQTGNAYLESGMPAKAENYLLKALGFLKGVGNMAQIKDTYRSLAVCSEQLNKYREAYKYHQLYSDIKDTIYNEENSRQTTEMSTKYETEKKEKEIVLQKAEISTKEAENKKQQLFLLLIAAIAVAVGVIAVVIFRSLGVTRRQKRVIEMQKHLVDEKNKHIEEKQKEIIDSITYAKRLQQAILPPVEMIKKNLPESFVLYKPKDIVAGDFYWMEVCPSPTLPEGKGENPKYQTARNSSYSLLKQLQEERKKHTTETEQILWNYLKGKKLEEYKFRRQHIIDEFIVDFVCLSNKTIVEVDGKYHDTPEMIEADKLRTEILRNTGYKIIRFKNEEVIGDIDNVLMKIRMECLRTDTPLPSGGAGGGLTIFLAAADCTGHGVPGALVSVVCSNALNRAVKEFGLRDTGKILDKVTDMVLETFEKSSSDVKDGMDISLLKIEFTPPLSFGEGPACSVPEFGRVRSIQWTGANNPLWYFQNGKLAEVKADKQPVGKYDNRKPFTTHTIVLASSPNRGGQEGAIFFLFTDGYPDQFGGPKGKKFKYSQLEKLLISNHLLPMDEQRTILDKNIDEWRGDLEQVDDICVIGVRV